MPGFARNVSSGAHLTQKAQQCRNAPQAQQSRNFPKIGILKTKMRAGETGPLVKALPNLGPTFSLGRPEISRINAWQFSSTSAYILRHLRRAVLAHQDPQINVRNKCFV